MILTGYDGKVEKKRSKLSSNDFRRKALIFRVRMRLFLRRQIGNIFGMAVRVGELGRAENGVHGFSKGAVFDHHEEVDGVSLELAGFPDPVAVADDEVTEGLPAFGVGLNQVVFPWEFPQGDALLTEKRRQRDFTRGADLVFGPGHAMGFRTSHFDVSSGVG